MLPAEPADPLPMILPPERRRFVGRKAELAALRGALAAAGAGRATTVLVTGEAGIGKSRLIAELAPELPSATVQGSCIDCGDSPLPYGALSDALRSLDRLLGDERRRDLVAPAREYLTTLLAGLGTEASAEDRHGARTRFFAAVLDLLIDVAAAEPVVAIIEDLHWSDRSSRDLLSYLVANLGDASVLLVLTCRTDSLPRGHAVRQFLVQLARQPSVSRLDLQPFTRAELVEQLTEVAGSVPEDELVETVWTRSEGNPFFAEELFEAASRRSSAAGLARPPGLLGPPSLLGPPGGGVPLPDSLSELLLARLGQLSNSTQDVLRAVAVGGPKVSHDLLVATAGVSEEALDLAVREAFDHEVLVVDWDKRAYEFRSALLREVASAQLLPGEVRRLHRRFGEQLTARPELCVAPSGVAAELARHWDAAGVPARALPAALEAAAMAEGVFGFAEASQHLERALDLWERVPAEDRPAGTDRLTLLQRAAAARHLAGEHRWASQLMRAAIDEASRAGQVEGPSAGRLWISLGRYLWAGGQSEDSLHAYEEAVRQVPADVPSVERAELLAAEAEALRHAARYRDSLHRAEEAIEVARLVGAPSQERDACTTLGHDLVMLGEADAGLGHLRRSLDLAESMNDWSAIAGSYHHLALALSGPLCRLEEASREVDNGLDWAARHGLERSHGVALQVLAADTLFRRGRWDEAEEYAAKAISWEPTGAVAIDLLLARAKVSVGRGRFASAAEDLRVAAERSARAVDTRFKLPLCTLEAGLALWQGRLDAARIAINEGLQRAMATDDVWFVLPLLWHGLWAEADDAARFGRSKQSRRAAMEERGSDLLDHANKLRGQGSQRGGLDLVADAFYHLCEGEAARLRGEGNEQAWSVASAAWTELAQPYPAAYARWRQAEVVLSRPGGAGAAMLLRDAHRMAMGLRAEPLRKAIEAMGGHARIELERFPPGADERGEAAAGDQAPQSGIAVAVKRFGLTPREREVLELLVEGCSNRQIAGKLFISEKTASVHVSNLLRKLGARSRVEAAGIAGQNRWP